MLDAWTLIALLHESLTPEGCSDQRQLIDGCNTTATSCMDSSSHMARKEAGTEVIPTAILQVQ